MLAWIDRCDEASKQGLPKPDFKENDGSPSVSSVSTISFDNAIVTDVGSNTVVISGTIGDAEDGTYEDGLFTSFTKSLDVTFSLNDFL